MTVLILTDSLDVHGDAARWALANRGWNAYCGAWINSQVIRPCPRGSDLTIEIR